MIISSWTIRGLNDPIKVVAVKKLCRKYKIQVMTILKTRVREVNKN